MSVSNSEDRKLRGAQRTSAGRDVLVAGIVLLVLTLIYWKVRIIDLAVNVRPSFYSADLYTQHYLMTSYGFTALRAGHLPLWNPYQLCGLPFLATAPYVGMFYPLNVVYLLFGTASGTEVSFVLHMLLGAVSMWWLLRHFGIGMLGALSAALTFVWAGWLIFNANQPALFVGMTWIPATVLAVDLVAQGRRLAWVGFIVVVSCQTLQGTIEIFVHASYVAALFAAARLTQLAWRGAWRTAVRRGALLLACIAAGVLLAAPQLLPTWELVRLSDRAPGTLSFEQVELGGSVPPLLFLRGALGGARAAYVTVGLFPLFAAVLVIGYRRHRIAWICGLATTIVAALLVFGGPLYRLYYDLPIGTVFRRPLQFLDLYVFGQALLVGVAVARLESWVDLPRLRLWLQPVWLVSLALGAAALLWLSTSGTTNPYLIALLVLLVIFGGLGPTPLRRWLLLGLCVLHGVNLFFASGNRYLRPVQQPDVLTLYDYVMRGLRDRAGYDRTYVFQALTGRNAQVVKWGIEPKQMMSGVYMAFDYEPLVSARYGRFFGYASGHSFEPFMGGYGLGAQTRWRLMDLTGTKYFVAFRGEMGDAFLSTSGRLPGTPKFRLIRDGFVRIYEKDGVLPRAHVVPHARVITDSQQVLPALDDTAFNPREEVILEEDPGEMPTPPSAGIPPSEVKITEYEPERVTLSVEGITGGFLVLSDLLYPGWRAFVNGREVPIFRANYLFRAVRVAPGHSVVRFEYQPRSFRIGVALSAAAAVLIVAGAAWNARRT